MNCCAVFLVVIFEETGVNFSPPFSRDSSLPSSKLWCTVRLSQVEDRVQNLSIIEESCPELFHFHSGQSLPPTLGWWWRVSLAILLTLLLLFYHALPPFLSCPRVWGFDPWDFLPSTVAGTVFPRERASPVSVRVWRTTRSSECPLTLFAIPVVDPHPQCHVALPLASPLLNSW